MLRASLGSYLIEPVMPVQLSNFTIESLDGEVSYSLLNTSTPRYTVLLETNMVRRSAIFQEAGCIRVGLNTTSRRVNGFLTTYDDFIGMTE